MLFNSNIKIVGQVESASQEEIRQLPMFYRSDLAMVYKLGGEVYRRVLDLIPFSGKRKYISIDSRVQMLMPNWLPCIGGWHCDDFYLDRRGAAERDGAGKAVQPDLQAIANDPKLQMTHWSCYMGTTSPTQFIAQPFKLPLEELDLDNLYSSCHKWIVNAKPRTFYAIPGEIVEFGSFDFHRGTRATNHSWRLFVRFTESDVLEPKNELRTQIQIYLPTEGTGW